MSIHPITRRTLLLRSLQASLGLAAVGALPEIISGCSSSGTTSLGTNPSGKITGSMEMWGWPGGIDGPQALYSQFQAKHPGTSVRFVSSGQTDELSKLLSSLISGVGGPDLGMVIEADTEAYVRPNALVELTSRMQPIKGDFVPGSLQVASTPDGKIWGVPADAVPAGLLYRADLFAKYGVKPEDVSTWDDYLNVGKEVVGKSKGQTKMLFISRNDPFVWLQRNMHSELASGFFSLDGKKVTIDDDANVTALTMTKKMWDAGIAWQDISDNAQAGYIEHNQVMTVPHAVWEQDVIRTSATGQDGKWRLEKLPAFTPGGNRNSRNSGSTFIIPKQAKNPELAFEFIRFAQDTPENQLLQFQKFFLFPSNKNTYNLPHFNDPVPFLGGQQANAIWADIYLNAPPYRFTPHYAVAVSAVNNYIAKVLGGSMTPSQGLKAAADEVRSQSGLS